MDSQLPSMIENVSEEDILCIRSKQYDPNQYETKVGTPNSDKIRDQKFGDEKELRRFEVQQKHKYFISLPATGKNWTSKMYWETLYPGV